MNEQRKTWKKLRSMKNDIFSRVSEKNSNSKVSSGLIQPKLNKFIAEVSFVEQEFYKDEHTDAEVSRFNEEIDEFRRDIESIQQKLSEKKESVQNLSNEDQILGSLAFLKEISNEMLNEINAQNKILEKKLTGVDNQKQFFAERQSGLTRSQTFINYFPNSCLITSMITLALIIVLLISLL